MWRKTIKKEQNTDLSETIVYLSIKTGYKTNNCGKRSSANSVSKKITRYLVGLVLNFIFNPSFPL